MTLPANPKYLAVKNTQERGAIIAIITTANKLFEKSLTRRGASFSAAAKAPRLSKAGVALFANNISGCSFSLRFNEGENLIVATMTPH